VLKYISQITTSPVPICPKLCILGIYPDDCILSCKERKMIDLCLLQAKRASEFYNIWKLFLELLKSGNMEGAVGE